MRCKYKPREGDHGVHGYEHFIRSDLNTTVGLCSVTSPTDVLATPYLSQTPSHINPLTVSIIDEKANVPSIVLHPLYPGSEEIPSSQVNNIHIIFGQRLGVPF